MADIRLNIDLNNGEKLILGKKELLSLETLSQSTGQPKEIFYGVISSTGSAEINDIYGNIEKSITDGTIPNSNMPIQITANGKQAASQITTESDYDNTSKTFSIQFTDTLSQWDNLQYSGRALNTDSNGIPISENAYSLICDVLSSQGYLDSRNSMFKIYHHSENIYFDDGMFQINASGGWEIIGFPLKTIVGKHYHFCLQYSLRSYEALSGYEGVLFMALNSFPTDSDCINISDAYTVLPSGNYQQIELEFDATSSLTYIVLNFGGANDNQTLWFEFDGIEAIEPKYLNISNMLSNYIATSKNTVMTVYELLKSFNIPAPCLESGSLREVIDRFCTLAQLNVIQDDNEQIKFVSARPVRVGNKPIIVIPPKNQFSSIKKDVIVKNKYDGVELLAKKADDVIDYDTIVYNEKIPKENFPDIIYQQGNEKPVTAVHTNSIGSNNYSNFATVFTKIDNLEYTEITIEIPKKQDYNKATILKIKNGVDNENNPQIKTSFSYQIKNGDVTADISQEEKGSAVTISNIQYLGAKKTSEATTSEVQDTIEFERTRDYNGAVAMSSSSVTNLSNIKTANIIETSSSYTVTLKVLTKKRFTAIYRTNLRTFYFDGSISNSPAIYGNYSTDDGDNWLGYEEYILQQVEITLYGNKRIISYEDLEQGSENGKNIVSLQGSELTQQYGNQETFSQIKNNILSDYANGIETATVTVSCSDYYDTNGVKQKTWANGEIFQVGDYVRLDKDNHGNSAFKYADGSPKIWKVTGRKFRNGGCPYVDLELQENKTVT